MKTERNIPCPFEDEVLTVFLDGEPSNNVSALEDHLASCLRCKEILDQSRELDAILASRTLVSVSDSEASQFLAFLPENATSSNRNRSLRLLNPFPIAVLAASLLISFGVLVFAKNKTPKLQDMNTRESHPKVAMALKPNEPPRSFMGAEVPGVSLGIDVLNQSFSPRLRKKRKHWKGGFSFGLRMEAAQILKREIGFFHVPNLLVPCGVLAQGERVSSFSFGPRSFRVESRDAALAWLTLQLGRGYSSVVPLLAQVVESGNQDLGLSLVSKFRGRPSAVAHLRKWLRQRRACSLQAAALLGAVQDSLSIPLLVQRGTPSLLEALRAARSLHGAQAFPFLLALWLETQRRDPALASRLASSWFEGMEAHCFREGIAILNRTQSKGRGSERNGIRKLFRSLGASSD